MAVLVALLAFLVGAAVGAAVAVWWLQRRPLASPSLDATPEAQPAGEPEAAAVSEVADPDLKPILDATRGVVSDLEERYRGRRTTKGDG